MTVCARLQNHESYKRQYAALWSLKSSLYLQIMHYTSSFLFFFFFFERGIRCFQFCKQPCNVLPHCCKQGCLVCFCRLHLLSLKKYIIQQGKRMAQALYNKASYTSRQVEVVWCRENTDSRYENEGRCKVQEIPEIGTCDSISMHTAKTLKNCPPLHQWTLTVQLCVFKKQSQRNHSRPG